MFTLAMSAGVLHGRLVQLPVKLGLRPPGESAHALRCEVANLHSHLHEGVDRDLVGISPEGPSRVSTPLLGSRAFRVALQADFHGTSYPSVVSPA